MELGNMLFGKSRGEFAIEDRYAWLDVLYPLFEAMGSDEVYGVDFENDVFTMHRYWWGDCTCGQEDTDADVDCAPTCALVRPNFRFKATGYEIRWYKYALRDSYQSHDLTLTQFAAMIAAMIAACVASLTLQS